MKLENLCFIYPSFILDSNLEKTIEKINCHNSKMTTLKKTVLDVSYITTYKLLTQH